jgi:hypothetical protein
MESPARSSHPIQLSKEEQMATQNPRDVVVTKQSPLRITDDDRSFGTVTIEPGGQILVLTAADVRIEHLIKK